MTKVSVLFVEVTRLETEQQGGMSESGSCLCCIVVILLGVVLLALILGIEDNSTIGEDVGCVYRRLKQEIRGEERPPPFLRSVLQRFGLKRC